MPCIHKFKPVIIKLDIDRSNEINKSESFYIYCEYCGTIRKPKK